MLKAKQEIRQLGYQAGSEENLLEKEEISKEVTVVCVLHEGCAHGCARSRVRIPDGQFFVP